MDFYFSSWAEFWAMGKHGFYVWLAYGSGVLVLAYNVWAVSRHTKAVAKQAQRSYWREQQRIKAMQNQTENEVKS